MSVGKEILEILGKNATDPAVFNDKMEVSAIYTYEGGIYCLEGGMDFDFSEVSKMGQQNILNALKNKRYIIDASYQ